MSDFGLILRPIDDDETSPKRNYVLGGYSGITSRPILMPGGHGWGAFKPVPELQAKNGVETMNCTNYGTNNCFETLARFKGFDDFPKDCSERYTGIASGTTHEGNDPHHVAEVIRTDCGEIPEASLPFNDTVTSFDEYYSPKDLGVLKDFGRRLLNKFKFGHEWVFGYGASMSPDQKHQALITALSHGPVCISVFAWATQGDGMFFRPQGVQDNHWPQLLDYVDGLYWTVNDHYDQTEKHLHWDFDFGAAKVYYLDRITPAPATGWDRFWDMIWRNFTNNHLLGWNTYHL